MSSLIHWFQKRRWLSEEATKDKMLGYQIKVTKKGRGGLAEREVTMKKQMSFPDKLNYSYFCLESDHYDSPYDYQENMYDQYASVYGHRDSIYGRRNSEFILGYQPVWSCQRNYSEQSRQNIPFVYNSQVPQPVQFSNRIPTTSGVVLQHSFSHPRRLGEIKTRRKSDSLFNYVPKAFGDQDASRILIGEKKEDILPTRQSLQGFSKSLERRSSVKSVKSKGLTSNCVTINRDNQKNGHLKRFSRTCSLDRPTFPDVDEESLDQTEIESEGHFFFTTAMLMEVVTMEDKENQEAVSGDEGHLKDIADNDSYNINSKSADEEVSNILKEFENLDHYNGNISECLQNEAIRQEFLY